LDPSLFRKLRVLTEALEEKEDIIMKMNTKIRSSKREKLFILNL